MPKNSEIWTSMTIQSHIHSFFIPSLGGEFFINNDLIPLVVESVCYCQRRSLVLKEVEIDVKGAKTQVSTPNGLIPIIGPCKGIPLPDLKLFDLVLPQELAHGVYMFFDGEGECRYVGKCTSRTLVARIGAHFSLFDSRFNNNIGSTKKKEWDMASFIKKIFPEDYEDYDKVMPSLNQYSLKYIPVLWNGKDESKEYARKVGIIERALQKKF